VSQNFSGQRTPKEITHGIPDGLIAHIASPTETGYRVTEVWQSEDHWKRFRTGVLTPLLQRREYPDSSPRLVPLLPDHLEGNEPSDDEQALTHKGAAGAQTFARSCRSIFLTPGGFARDTELMWFD
jgi:hypothetical protein